MKAVETIGIRHVKTTEQYAEALSKDFRNLKTQGVMPNLMKKVSFYNMHSTLRNVTKVSDTHGHFTSHSIKSLVLPSVNTHGKKGFRQSFFDFMVYEKKSTVGRL